MLALLVANFVLGLIFFVLLVPAVRLVLPAITWTSCSEFNWSGYNMCEHNSWIWSFWISSILSTLLGILFGLKVQKLLNISGIGIWFGVIVFYVPIILVVFVSWVLDNLQGDGTGGQLWLFGIIYGLSLFILTVLSSVLNLYISQLKK